MAVSKDSGAEAEEHKARGNGLLKDGKFCDAVEAYTKAIELNPAIAAFWSNRSHANLKAGQLDEALRDAEEAVVLHPSWAKGHHRKAKALQELGRFEEAAAACSEGAKAASGSSEASEVKLLERLRGELMLEAAGPALLGWWHGKVSAALGGFEQEFHFMGAGKMQCVVYGQELEGTYKLAAVEKSQGGGFTGGLDVSLNDTKVPYLFKVGESDCMLHLCCPMNSPELRPRTFDGPGYLGMSQGRAAGGDAAEVSELKELSEGQRILRYLDELTEIMMSNPALQEQDPENRDTRAELELMERLEDSNGTLTQQQLCGQESLEDKEKRLQTEQTLSALRLKHTPEIEEAAHKLIKKEVKASSLYPKEEVREMEKRLKRFKNKEPQEPEVKAEDAPKPVLEASTKEESVKQVVEEPVKLNGRSLDAEPTGSDAAQPKAVSKPPERGSCFQGCFAGLSK